jgi:sulfatase modifying factor 1
VDAAPRVNACCAPQREPAMPAGVPVPAANRFGDAVAPRAERTAFQAGGTFDMGSDDLFHPDDAEGPIRKVQVGPFALDRHAVTNARFAQFVAETDYVTDAERFGWSFVFYRFLGRAARDTLGVREAPWWRKAAHANWSAPEGPQSEIAWRMDHPVVHVSWNDATAFAAWARGRLPSEAEWEFAARGGLHRRRFPWGDEEPADPLIRCNIWRGEFPHQSDDRRPGTVPVNAFEPNGYGLYNMVGNVWEWCADDRGAQGKAIRGGSYLCHRSYCYRYRVAARSANGLDSSTGHMGFRLAYDIAERTLGCSKV